MKIVGSIFPQRHRGASESAIAPVEVDPFEHSNYSISFLKAARQSAASIFRNRRDLVPGMRVKDLTANMCDAYSLLDLELAGRYPNSFSLKRLDDKKAHFIVPNALQPQQDTLNQLFAEQLRICGINNGHHQALADFLVERILAGTIVLPLYKKGMQLGSASVFTRAA